MAVLTVNQIAAAKQAQALAAANGGGDSFPNTGKEFIAVRNAGAGAITLTVVAQGDPCSLEVAASPAHDGVYSIPNDSATYVFGPFKPKRFNDVNGRAQVTYSGVTSVTIEIFSLPPAA